LYDVIVIGGGPAGSQVAYRLAGMGYQVVVLERREKLGKQVCCTGIISHECVDAFDIDSDVILRRLNSARLYSPSGRLLKLWREGIRACVVDRAAFDVAIASRAQSAGAEYIFGNRVTDIEVRDDRVRVEAARQFEARAVVVATGFGSRLSKRLGLGRVGDFVVGAQAGVETDGVDEVEVYFGYEVAPGFFGWLVPTSNQKALVGVLSRHNCVRYLRNLLSSLKAEDKIISDDVVLSYGGIPLKPLSRTYGDRVLVVGDAAGQVKPTTGGGIYYGLLCAEIAARNLDRALKSDNLSAGSLARYEREWKKKLGRELRAGYYARKFYERLSDEEIDKLFDIIESRGISDALLNKEGLSFDWHGEVVFQLLRNWAFNNLMRFAFR